MAINILHKTESAAVTAMLDIDQALVQAHSIVRVIGACVTDALPPETLQEACWAVADLIKRANARAGDLARLAQRVEADHE